MYITHSLTNQLRVFMAAPDKLSPLLYTTITLNDVTRYGGYHRELFTRSFSILEEALVICTLCTGVKRDACTYQGMTTCKRCSHSPDKATPVRDIRELVARLVIKCPLSSRGCKWTGNVTEGESHLQRCKELLCKCPNKCELGVSRRTMEQHSTLCPMREVTCEHCATEMLARNVESHLLTCGLYPVKCPSCETILKREEMAEHLNKCSNKRESQRISIPIIPIEIALSKEDETTDRNVNEDYLSLKRETEQLKSRVTSLERKNDILTKALFSKPELMKYDAMTGRILEGFKWCITDVTSLTNSVSTLESPPFYVWHHNMRITANSGVLGSISFSVSRIHGLYDEILGDNSLSYYRCELVPVGEEGPKVLSGRINHKLDLQSKSNPFLFLDISLLKDELYCQDNIAILHLYFDLTH